VVVVLVVALVTMAMVMLMVSVWCHHRALLNLTALQEERKYSF
jgi:hypothetical protein